jgi:hypothetical protein
MEEDSIQRLAETPKPKSFLLVLIPILILLIIIVGAGWYLYTANKGSDQNIKNGSHEAVNGKYVDDTRSPLYGSEVVISSSTPESIDYDINTFNLGHAGELVGKAQRLTATTTTVYEDLTSNDGCSVSIHFIDGNHLFYVTQDVGTSTYDGYVPSCNDYHGFHGTFMDHDVHTKNGVVTLDTVQELGFTDADAAAFEKLAPGAVSDAAAYQKFSVVNDSTGTSASSTVQISSPDIPGSHGFAISEPNLYNGGFSCSSGGDCGYAAFMKDAHNNYWILFGSTGAVGSLDYVTSSSSWKNNIPEAFQKQADDLGISIQKKF